MSYQGNEIEKTEVNECVKVGSILGDSYESAQ